MTPVCTSQVVVNFKPGAAFTTSLLCFGPFSVVIELAKLGKLSRPLPPSRRAHLTFPARGVLLAKDHFKYVKLKEEEVASWTSLQRARALLHLCAGLGGRPPLPGHIVQRIHQVI